jgi:autotransporter translocation and assembly factor TamB
MKMVCVPALCLGLITINNCNPNAIDGSGVSKTESRAVGSFSRIDLSGSPDVEVAVGPATSVSVTADDNVLPTIETTVSGDTLSINSKGSYNTRLGVKVNITVAMLDGVSVSGSGDIHVTGLKAGEMDAGVTGSGDVTLNGAVDRLSAKITGSGDLRGGDLDAKHVRVTVTGSGNATIRATEELDASVTGSGDVRYSGNPPQVRKNVTGSGDISPR